MRCHRLTFLQHVYHDGGTLNWILDDGKLVNHSASPNTGRVLGSEEPLSSYALQDLAAGEEVMEDYSTYSYPPWLLALSRQYGEDFSYFTLPDVVEQAH